MSRQARKRKVAIVTGTRAEYGLLRSTMHEIARDSSLGLQVVVAGMHLAKQFGGTELEIEKDGFRISGRVQMTPKSDSSAAMAGSVGQGILGMVGTFKRLKPDVVVVLGDRVEALSAAIAAAYMNIPLAHVHGGDSAKAGLDESARHAITKFAHIHFAATRKSAQRIQRLGEPRARIHVVGAPGLDEVLHGVRTAPEALSRKYHIQPDRPLALLLQHSVTTESEHGAKQIRETLAAIVSVSLQTVAIYPNADAGGRGMIPVIKFFETRHHSLRAYPSVPRADFLGLMSMANVLVGNSSSGIIEAASFGLPVVNVGTRQEGRERAGNVVDVQCSRKEITKALRQVLSGEFVKRARRTKNPYGDGFAGRRIARAIRALPSMNKAFIQKNMTY